MKKLILGWMILATCAASTSALGFAVGARGGGSASWLFGTTADAMSTSLKERGAGAVSPQTYFSYSVDIFGRLVIVDWFAVQMECGFGPVGGALLASDGIDFLEGVTGNELHLPILAVFMFRTPIGTFSLEGGAFAAVMLGNPTFIQNDGLVWSGAGLPVPFLSGGLAVGVGYELKLGPGSVVLDLRYTHRLFSMIDPVTLGGEGLTPLAVNLSAGYMFSF